MTKNVSDLESIIELSVVARYIVPLRWPIKFEKRNVGKEIRKGTARRAPTLPNMVPNLESMTELSIGTQYIVPNNMARINSYKNC
jgi:hypothetical protein